MLTPLAAHPSLERGVLPNGLRYAILPLSAAPWSRDRRVAVHLEVQVGSIDERETEHLTLTLALTLAHASPNPDPNANADPNQMSTSEGMRTCSSTYPSWAVGAACDCLARARGSLHSPTSTPRATARR